MRTIVVLLVSLLLCCGGRIVVQNNTNKGLSEEAQLMLLEYACMDAHEVFSIERDSYRDKWCLTAVFTDMAVVLGVDCEESTYTLSDICNYWDNEDIIARLEIIVTWAKI